MTTATPADYKFLKSHEWAHLESDGTVTVGISDHAQHALGDLVFVEVPEIGEDVKMGEVCSVVESVKAASDVYSPVSGEVIAHNEALAATPEVINQDPYGAGWIMKVRPSSPGELAQLLDADAYAKVLAADAG